MSDILQITPFLQVQDVGQAVRFFVDILGFKAWMQSDTYGYVQRGPAAVRLVKASMESDEERYRYGPRTFLLYVDVSDIAALHAEIAPRLLAGGRTAGEGPVDQRWGQREWFVPGPEGGIIVFGQELPVVSQ